MKIGINLALALMLAASTAFAQQSQPSTNDLPSAPSAVIQQQQRQEQQKQEEADRQREAQEQQAQQLQEAHSAPATGASASQAAPATGAPATSASTPAAAPDDPPLETIRKNVDEVNVVFTVTDKHGHFVKDLKEDDFKVIDDNKPASRIIDFTRETNLPLRVGLLIDASNSIRDRFRFEQDAAIEFLNQIVRPRFDKAFVLGFDTTAEVTADFSDSSEVLSKGVRMLRPGGGTALYDAVYYACRDKLLKNQEKEGIPTRRAIILLSDGDDNQSRVTREEAIEMAQRAEVVIYTISTNVSGVKMKGDKVLERMAEMTGGRAFFPFKIEDVANAFSEIQDELRSQYLLAYKPADFVSDGKYRSIDIVAENHKNLRVRSRKGYYAPKQ
ncbi:MAG TPA: VWA domain-containing protein [Terriglobales bacterium]|nr:VWA domain-containing protein [Terriglobales bacterium]